MGEIEVMFEAMQYLVLNHRPSSSVKMKLKELPRFYVDNEIKIKEFRVAEVEVRNCESMFFEI